jgi:hypothetical protein
MMIQNFFGSMRITQTTRRIDMSVKKYDSAEHNRFVEDMTTSQYKVIDYHGKKFWRGPAVKCGKRSEVADVSSATRVRTIYEEETDGSFVVHPASY